MPPAFAFCMPMCGLVGIGEWDCKAWCFFSFRFKATYGSPLCRWEPDARQSVTQIASLFGA